jgi:hypothetical protein
VGLRRAGPLDLKPRGGEASDEKTLVIGFVPHAGNNISLCQSRPPDRPESLSRLTFAPIVFCGKLRADRSCEDKVGNMPLSLTDVLLSPVERPRCNRCRTSMNLTSIIPRPDHSERRIFECPKCRYINTKIAIDPLRSKEINRLTDNVRPPA